MAFEHDITVDELRAASAHRPLEEKPDRAMEG